MATAQIVWDQGAAGDHADVADDAGIDHRLGAETLDQPAIKYGAGEREQIDEDDHDQAQHIADAHLCRQRDRHLDDRVDTVDIKEIRETEQEDVAVAADILEGAPQPAKGFPHHMIDRFMVFFLSDIFQHRSGIDQPPEHGHGHRQAASPAIRQRKGADLHISQQRHERKGDDEDQKRQRRADIAPGIAGRRHFIHSLIVIADIHDERIIEDDRAIVADHGDHEDDQRHAVIDERQRQRKSADDPDIQEKAKHLHLSSLIVRDRAQDRRHHRQQQAVHRIGPADIDAGISRRNLRDQQREDDRARRQHLCRVADVIEDPARLLFRIAHFCQYPCKHAHSSLHKTLLL